LDVTRARQLLTDPFLTRVFAQMRDEIVLEIEQTPEPTPEREQLLGHKLRALADLKATLVNLSTVELERYA
jgi:hypothetical protein